MTHNYLPVVTYNKRPLAPCHLLRATSLVKLGKAHMMVKRGVRYLVLHKTKLPKVRIASKVVLRIDPGSKKTGIAITRDHKDGSREVLLCLEIHHQGRAIKGRLLKRRQNRRNRRGRKTRYRKPRFNNRKRQKGWVPPSILSRLQNTRTWVKRLAKLLPITEIHVETNTFDPQVLRNPEIEGKQYQQGPLYRTNLKAAVLLRDGNKCVYCGKSGKRTKLEMEHAVAKSAVGPDRYDNRVASCEECNDKKGTKSLEEFLKRRSKKLAEIKAKLGTDLADASHMNIILPRLLADLRQDGWTVIEHAAATTAAGRIVCNIEKSHHGDAAVTGCPDSLRYMPSAPIAVGAKGRGNRQRLIPDKYGSPRGKEFSKYSKMPRHVQAKTTPPSHKKRQKRVGGVATGDYISFKHEGTTVHGYGALNNESVRILAPNWKSTKAKWAAPIERYHGYEVAYPARGRSGN